MTDDRIFEMAAGLHEPPIAEKHVIQSIVTCLQQLYVPIVKQHVLPTTAMVRALKMRQVPAWGI